MVMKSRRGTGDLLLLQRICLSVHNTSLTQSLPVPVSPVLSSLPSLPPFHFTVRHMTNDRLTRLRRVVSPAHRQAAAGHGLGGTEEGR